MYNPYANGGISGYSPNVYSNVSGYGQNYRRGRNMTSVMGVSAPRIPHILGYRKINIFRLFLFDLGEGTLYPMPKIFCIRCHICNKRLFGFHFWLVTLIDSDGFSVQKKVCSKECRLLMEFQYV